MKWASAISTRTRFRLAVEEAAESVLRQLDSQVPDLVLVFLSREFGFNHDRLAQLVRAELGDGVLFGCGASGVIGAGREIEQQPAVAITAAILPEVTLEARHLDATSLPPTYAERAAWEALLGVEPGAEPHFLIVADPFTFDAERLVQGLDRAFPESIKLGGLASGAREAGGNVLCLRERTHRAGAIVLSMSGNVRIDTIVAQGCRPIGDPLFVTGAHGNLLRELDGKTPRAVLGAIFEKLDPRDRELAQHSLFIGLALPVQSAHVRAGEFLVRNVIGLDRESGALYVAADLEQNAIVQFHLRDAQSSAEDLERALAAKARGGGPRPRGVLLFSCVGRGAGLYGSPDHDSNALRRHLGELPIGGFFCSGEIGPVQGLTHLHGYTSAVGLFSPAGRTQ